MGEDCAISWGCQFLDDDFHELSYEGRAKVDDPKIRIGSHVWIGSRVSVLKGAVIPDGCIVASNSVVGKVFTEKKLPHRRQSRQSDSTRCELEVRLSDSTFVRL